MASLHGQISRSLGTKLYKMSIIIYMKYNSTFIFNHLLILKDARKKYAYFHHDGLFNILNLLHDINI